MSRSVVQPKTFELVLTVEFSKH